MFIFKSKALLSMMVAIILALGMIYAIHDKLLSTDDFHMINTQPIETPPASDSSTPPPLQPTPSTPTQPPPAENNVPTKGSHLHINLDEKKMYVYKNGELLKIYPVSGGKASTPSPQGNWKVIGKAKWGEGFGGGWLGLNVPWGKYGIHGTVYPWLIGKSNSSKGCIRMKNADIKELYKMAPHGTSVVIVHENSIFRTLKSGCIGSDVVEMQRALKKLEYYNGSANGKFLDGFKKSVIKFQKANKLYGSGVINKQTYNLILRKSLEQS